VVAAVGASDAAQSLALKLEHGLQLEGFGQAALAALEVRAPLTHHTIHLMLKLKYFS
jgi:hypothetical protein